MSLTHVALMKKPLAVARRRSCLPSIKGRYLGEGVAPVCKVAARRFRSMHKSVQILLSTCFRAQLEAPGEDSKTQKNLRRYSLSKKNFVRRHLGRAGRSLLVQFEQPHQLVEAGKLQQPTRATERAGKPQQLLHPSRPCHTSLDSRRREL